MIRADTIKLIKTTPSSLGVFDTATTETAREVYCNVRSVGMSEFYRAAEIGLKPKYVFELADFAEYDNERICEWHNVRYDIIRVYIDGLKVELTVEEAKC